MPTVVLICDEGVLGFMINRYPNDVIKAIWYLDGIKYSSTLEKDEYLIITKGMIDGNIE